MPLLQQVIDYFDMDIFHSLSHLLCVALFTCKKVVVLFHSLTVLSLVYNIVQLYSSRTFFGMTPLLSFLLHQETFISLARTPATIEEAFSPHQTLDHPDQTLTQYKP